MGIDDSWSTAVNLTRRELMEQFALYADGKVNMHDRANMYPTSEDNDMIWGECVEIGIGATTRTVIAGDNCSQNSSLGIWMRGGHIAGHAATRGEVDAENNAQIDYPMNDFRIVEMPDLNVVTSETVGFPSSIVGQQWINVNPNDPPWPVDPNTHYGNVTLNSNAENDVYAGNTWINPSNWFSDYPAFYAGIGWNRRESNEDFPQNDRLFAFRWECCDWCGPETPPDMVDTMIFRIRQN